MSSKIAFLLTISVVFGICQTVWGQPWDGNGVESDPYLIYTAEDMQAVGGNPDYWDAHFKLCADIDLSAYTGTSFNLIGTSSTDSFGGVFDGNGHVVTNFRYETSVIDEYIGLFGFGGEIRNLGLINPTVIAEKCEYVGTLGGYLGKITNCYAENCIVVGNHLVGGLGGWNAGTITNCYVAGTVTGNSVVGGLIGGNNGFISYCFSDVRVEGEGWVGGFSGSTGSGGVIRNCYAHGSVSGVFRDVGGFCGLDTSYKESVSRCYSTCFISVSPGCINVGGFIGRREGYITYSFWDIETSGYSTSAAGVGKTTLEMQSQETYTSAGWDFASVWTFAGSGTYPRFHWYPIIADAGEDQFFDGIPSEVILDGSGSLSPYEPLQELMIKWNQTGGPEVNVADYNNITATFIPNEIGVYDFQLIIIDSNNQRYRDTVSVAVGGAIATIDIVGDEAVMVNDNLELGVSITYHPPQPEPSNLTFEWEKHDGPGSAVFSPNTTSRDVNVTFSTIGLYELTIRVYDAGQEIGTDDFSVEVVSYGGGLGTANDPYLLSTAEHMYALGLIRDNWDKHFSLVEDIDLSLYDGRDGRSAMQSTGNKATPFSGSFDGNNHTISNFRLATDGLGPVGLFAWVDGASVYIENLYFDGVEIDAQYASSVGCVVGKIEDRYAQILNCHVTNANITGYDYVGGIVGSTGGQIGVYVTIEDCHTIGNITGHHSVAGIIGHNGEATVRRCFSEGYVEGEGGVGGLVGASSGESTIDSYSLSSVYGISNVGGLVGYNGRGAVQKCYSAGHVSGVSDVGSLVGYDYSGFYTSCFWNSDVNPDVNGIGSGSDPDVIGETTENMQTESTFTDAGWDFVGETVNGMEDIWDICEGTNYPKLVWSIPAGDFLCPDGVNFLDYAFLAERWLMTDYGDVGGVELTGDGKIDLNDFARFAEYWRVTGCGDCGGADYTGEGDVDVADLEVFTGAWLGSEYGDCEEAELSGDGKVGAEDLGAFAGNWLEGF